MQFIWWIFWFFILISWIFYLYPDKPDIEWFIKSRIYKISVMNLDENVPKKDAYIQIVDSKRANDFDIVPNFEKQISETSKISYPSKKTNRDENIVVTTPYWEIIWLQPQSEIQLEFSGDSLINLLKLNWEVWFLSWVFNSSVDFSGGIILSSEQQEWIEWVQHNYKYDLVSYLKNQISDNGVSLVNTSVMYNIDGKVIKWLARMFPASFTKNLHNYNEFQDYFDWVDEWENVWIGKYEMKKDNSWSFSSLWDSFVGNMKIWKGNTYNVFKKH